MTFKINSRETVQALRNVDALDVNRSLTKALADDNVSHADLELALKTLRPTAASSNALRLNDATVLLKSMLANYVANNSDGWGPFAKLKQGTDTSTVAALRTLISDLERQSGAVRAKYARR